MSSVPRAFVRTPNSRAALTIHAKLFTFTRVKRVHARVHIHACVKFKVSGTVCGSKRCEPDFFTDGRGLSSEVHCELLPNMYLL